MIFGFFLLIKTLCFQEERKDSLKQEREDARNNNYENLHVYMIFGAKDIITFHHSCEEDKASVVVSRKLRS